MSDPSDNPPVLRFETIDSTMLEARRRVGGLDGPRVFVAAEQSQGVGRLGRPWHSPRGGLWMTVAHPVKRAAPHAALNVSQAVRRVLLGLGVPEVRIKWPNDVLVGDSKIAGVLVEVVSAGGRRWALVGVGVNANIGAMDLAPVLRGQATTLRESLGGDVDLAAIERDLISGVCASMAGDVSRIEQDALWGVGRLARAVSRDGAVREGNIAGVSGDGALMLKTTEGLWCAPMDVRVEVV